MLDLAVPGCLVIVVGKKDRSTASVCMVRKPTTPFLIAKSTFASTSTFSQPQPLVSLLHRRVDTFDFNTSHYCPVCVGVCQSFLEGFLCRPSLPHQACDSSSGDSVFSLPPLELFTWSDSTTSDDPQTTICEVERCISTHHEDVSTWLGLGVHQVITTSAPRVHLSAHAEIVFNHMFRHKGVRQFTDHCGVFTKLGAL